MILLIGACGYIGSALYEYLSQYHEVKSVDLEWFGNSGIGRNFCFNYDDLTKEYIADYETIILTAAHSSVKMCDNNAYWAIKNNVLNFQRLIDKMGPDSQLIYMSSSSVYNGGVVMEEKDLKFESTNIYDMTKFEADSYAAISGKKTYGLRLGTVNGYSPNLRSDLMMNKMFLDGKKNGEILLYNGDIYRPILYIQDLCRAISRMIDFPGTPGVYNLASFNEQIKTMASFVSNYIDAPLVDKGTAPSYDFTISCTKFREEFDFYDFTHDFEEIMFSLQEGLKRYTLIGDRNEAIQKG